MPIYDYRCAACGHAFEVAHGVHGSGPEACPSCGGAEIRKAISAPSVHFKGSGWAKKERASSARAARDTGTEGGTGTSGEDSSKEPAPSSSTPAPKDAAPSPPATGSASTTTASGSGG
jgi:putative FmdB family regulatory protein